MQFKPKCNFLYTTGEQMFPASGRRPPVLLAVAPRPRGVVPSRRGLLCRVPLVPWAPPKPGRALPCTRTRREPEGAACCRPLGAVVCECKARTVKGFCEKIFSRKFQALDCAYFTALILDRRKPRSLRNNGVCGMFHALKCSTWNIISGYTGCSRSSRRTTQYLAKRPAVQIQFHAQGHLFQHHQDSTACVSP